MGLSLPTPKGGKPDVLVIAGEHSGDEHAARLVSDFRKKHPQSLVCALGGPKLNAAGAQLLYDLTESSVVGLFDVLKNISFYKDIFEATFNWIETHQPKVVLFVDYPGFNLRLAERMYKRGLASKAGGHIKLAYYISPQIWAWKSKRRFKMAQWLDRLSVIFPFELDCYKDTTLKTEFVGHPFVDEGYRNNLSYSANAPVLLLPGSRKAPVKRILPVMLEAFQLFRKQNPQEKALIVYPSMKIHNVCQQILRNYPSLRSSVNFVSNASPVSGKAVLGSSGTMSLNFALAGIPGAIVYKAHPLTYCVGRMLVDIDRLGIANILMNDFVYPEFIQGNANPEILAKQLDDCTSGDHRREQVQKASQDLHKLLSKPSDLSAGLWLSDVLDNSFSHRQEAL